MRQKAYSVFTAFHIRPVWESSSENEFQLHSSVTQDLAQLQWRF